LKNILSDVGKNPISISVFLYNPMSIVNTVSTPKEIYSCVSLYWNSTYQKYYYISFCTLCYANTAAWRSAGFCTIQTSIGDFFYIPF